jgi:hypothetical protein
MKHAASQSRSATFAAPTPERYTRALEARHDALEDEAERAADLALALPENAPSLNSAKRLQPAAFVTMFEAIPASVTRTLAEPGLPLDSTVRADMERRFGYDFSKVRVHASGAAAASAIDVEADAYAAGHHVVFAPGQFAPQSQHGRHLLAHELAHVVQQSPQTVGLTSRRGLQRKARAELFPTPAAPLELDPTFVNDRADQPAVDAPAPPASLTPVPAPTQEEAPPVVGDGQQKGRAVPTRVGDAGAPPLAAPPARPAKAPPGDDTSMPRLSELVGERQPTVPEVDTVDGAVGAEPADVGELIGVLALGAHDARAIVDTHADAADSAIDGSARWTSKKVKDLTDVACKAAEAVVDRRLNQVERTLGAHSGQIDWLEKLALADADTYHTNAKKAMEDGFQLYRDKLVNAFDRWTRTFAFLKNSHTEWLKKETDENVAELKRLCDRYVKRYIDDIGGQSEGRREVQRQAAREVRDDYVKEFRAGLAKILPELAKAYDAPAPELNKARDAALVEYDKVLPGVLQGLKDQLSEAKWDIKFKAAEARDYLAKAKVRISDRVRILGRTTVERYATFRGNVVGQVKERRTKAEGQLRRARPQAMEPIAAKLSESAGMLTNTDEELDPRTARQFVGEVVDFSLAAADATSEVFVEARDAGVASIGGAIPFTRRGLAAGKQDLETKLHDEAIENDAALIAYSLEAETYVRHPLKLLDATYQAAVSEAATKLTQFVSDPAVKVREAMTAHKKALYDAVLDAKYKQLVAIRKFPNAMHQAAGNAKWRYDHDILKHVVDVVEVALGVALVLGAIVLLIVSLPLLLGEALAAAIFLIAGLLGAFAAGYFGAKAYDERRKKGQGVISSLLGAVGEITGINEVKRAFTDPKMKPFDRGLAWGGFLLNLFGAGQGAKRFFSAVKVKLPKSFTNPFKFRKPVLAGTPDLPAGIGAVDVPMPPPAKPIGFELSQPKLKAPDTPGSVPKPERIGFELPKQTLPDAELPPPTATPKSKPIGYELPKQKLPDPDIPATTAKSKPIGYELPKQKLPDADIPPPAAPPTRKPVGYELPETRTPKDVPPTTGGTGVTPRLHHRKQSVPETPGPKPTREIGFAKNREPVPAEAPVRADQPHMTGEPGPGGGVITEMPRARQVGGAEAPRATPEAPGPGATQTVGSSTPRTPHSEAPTGTPTKGAVTSTVEPDVPRAGHAEGRLSPDAEKRLAHEEALQGARERRIADEARVKKLEDDLEVYEHFDKQLGLKRKPDEVSKLVADTKRELQAARSDFRNSHRAELATEAADPVHLRRRPADVDPADPKMKAEALAERAERRRLIEKNEEVIRANEPDLADAKARVAQREKEFEATRPGSGEGKQSLELQRAREAARTRLKSAQDHLESVQNRTKPARDANATHRRRIEHIDRDLHPQQSGAKGTFAELEAHKSMDKQGYDYKGSKNTKKPGSGQSNEPGLDGVYEKNVRGDPAKPQHVVGEAKYDQANLRPEQRTQKWVDDRLDDAVGPTHAARMRKEGYEYWLMKYDPKTQRMLPEKKLWEWKPGQAKPRIEPSLTTSM